MINVVDAITSAFYSNTLTIYGPAVGSNTITIDGPLDPLPRFAERSLQELAPHIPAGPRSRDRATRAVRRRAGEKKRPGWRACRRSQ